MKVADERAGWLVGLCCHKADERCIYSEDDVMLSWDTPRVYKTDYHDYKQKSHKYKIVLPF